MSTSLGQRTVGHSAALCALLLSSVGCAGDTKPASAAPAEDEGPEPVAVTVFTDKVELFMEYPRLLPGLEARFLAHVTVLATGEPVRTGLERTAAGRWARAGGDRRRPEHPRPATPRPFGLEAASAPPARLRASLKQEQAARGFERRLDPRFPAGHVQRRQLERRPSWRVAFVA
jgi:hypothetical protein